jgi:hypothetical protein
MAAAAGFLSYVFTNSMRARNSPDKSMTGVVACLIEDRLAVDADGRSLAVALDAALG